MDKEIIVDYIKQKNGAEIADVQQKFEIPYKEVKSIISELVADGKLVFESGVRYAYVQQKDNLDERRAYLEERRQEIIKRMQETSEDDEDCEDYEDFEDEDELRYKALKLIIEKDEASISMFQRTFPIGYIKSCKLIDWMESKGYVSEGIGFTSRKVLITKEEFDKLFNESHIVDDKDEFEDDDDDLDIDAEFSEYEKFLQERMTDCDEDENDNEENCDDIINRILHLDADESEGSVSNSIECKRTIQNLVFVLNKITVKKKAPITADKMPLHPSWDNEDEFSKAVMDRLESLIKSDRRMGQQGAVKKAETYLEAVRDTHDGKMVQVYERLVYEIKNTGSYLYGQLKKQFFGE